MSNIITPESILAYIDARIEELNKYQCPKSEIIKTLTLIKDEMNGTLSNSTDLCFDVYTLVKRLRDINFNKSSVGILGIPIYKPVVGELNGFIQWFEN